MFEHCLSIPVFSASPRDVRTFKDYVLCVPNSLFSAPMFFKLVLAGVALGGSSLVCQRKFTFLAPRAACTFCVARWFALGSREGCMWRILDFCCLQMYVL